MLPDNGPDVAQLRASILVIGDELLGGFVQDTNSHWLAQRLRDHAVPLDRVQTVPDEFDDIDEALSAELARSRPRLVLTTGGIGSTPDDITFEAIAASLGRDTAEEPTIAERLRGALDWTRSQGVELDDEAERQFLRMSRVPAGATLLPTSGWAPALRVDVDGGCEDDGGATIIVLPGVPSQMRELVSTGVEPALLADRNEPWEVVEFTHGYPESLLNPVFLLLDREHPRVKVGSYPGSPMIVRLQGTRDDLAAAAPLVQRAIDELDDSEGGRRIRTAWAGRTGGDDTDEDQT